MECVSMVISVDDLIIGAAAAAVGQPPTKMRVSLGSLLRNILAYDLSRYLLCNKVCFTNHQYCSRLPFPWQQAGAALLK